MKHQIICFLWILLVPFYLKAQTIESCDEMIVEGVNEMIQKNHLISLEILTQAQTLAQQNHWAKQEFLAINNIGVNYYMMLDYGEALEHYLEAYKIAVQSLDAKFEMTVLNNIAILYSKEHEYNKAEEYFSKAFALAKENNDSIKIGYYALNLATVGNVKKEVLKAEELLKTASAYLKPDSDVYLLLQIAYARNLMLQNNLAAAKQIALRNLSHLYLPNLAEYRLSNLLLLSSIYEAENDHEKAIEYLQKALVDPQLTFENEIDAYTDLSEIYQKTKRFELAFAAKDSLIMAKDRFYKVKNGKLFENSRIKFELANYQKELLDSQMKLKQERRLFYWIIGGIFLMLLFSFWAFRNYFAQLKQREIIAANARKIAELELEKEKSDKLILEQQLSEQNVLAQLEQVKFKNELESKNRQLASKALSILTRNDLVENIIESLSLESEISQNDNLRRRIFELKNHLKRESDWDEFFSHFEATNDGFLSALKEKHPNLTANDVRFLSYVYMNLSSKEIALLLNITIEACRKRKERIVKKMNLDNSEKLYAYISAI
ncbi:MAG TPA: tetratricopeptide repeat protein [Moheibacter sp.]|nr:tetratricopeptide repeat protein [Moheibacter sp.]